MMFNDTSSLAAYLASRRSARPRDLIAPGPDAAQLRGIVAAAIRTPDHGKLAPWRVVHVRTDQRSAFADRLLAAYLTSRPAASQTERDAVTSFAHQAPTLLAVLSTPRGDSHIPLWEQQLSVGAFCMNLLHAVHSAGFAGGWVTGWAAYDDAVCAALGGGADDHIAAFLFIGTPAKMLEERPRPDVDAILSDWSAG